MTVTTWKPASVTLSFRLGEILLARRRLRGLADTVHFSQRSPTQLPPLPTSAELMDAEFVFFPAFPVVTPLPAISRQDGWIVYTPYQFKNYFVDLQRLGSFDAYLSQFSAKSRSTLKRKVRKFAEASGGSIDWVVAADSAQMNDFIPRARALSAKTYQERLLGAGLPTSDSFAAEMAARADRGAALGYLLSLESRPVAYVLCVCEERVSFYSYVGFDPDCQALSPGTVLQYLILEDMFGRGKYDIFDFTEGEGTQKAFFASDFRLCAKSYVLRQSPSNWATVFVHLGLNRASEWIGRMLDRFNVRSAVRKLIRRLA